MEANESEYLDECGCRGIPIVPFLMSKWSKATPAEILNECKKRGWVEVRVGRYVGWRMAQDVVLAAIEPGETVTTKILEERLGVPKGQISDDLLALSLYGLVKVVGKDGRWKLWRRNAEG